MNRKLTAVSFFILHLYIIFGSVLFYYLENPNEIELREKLKQYQLHFLSANNSGCIKIENLKNFVNAVIDASKAGVLLYHNQTSAWQWDFVGSLFFSLTTVSTIGYGNLAPVTEIGKIACIIYALFGIPIFLNTLKQIASATTEKIDKIEFCCFKTCHKQMHRVVLFFVILFLFAVVFVFPSLFVAYIENWTISDSLYYAFISLSTVGFGDFVAGNQPTQSRFYKGFLCLWLLYGLAFMATLIGYLQHLYRKILKRFTKNQQQVEPENQHPKGTGVTLM